MMNEMYNEIENEAIETEETKSGIDAKFALGVAGIAGGAILAERLLVKGVKKVKKAVTDKIAAKTANESETDGDQE